MPVSTFIFQIKQLGISYIRIYLSNPNLIQIIISADFSTIYFDLKLWSLGLAGYLAFTLFFIFISIFGPVFSELTGSSGYPFPTLFSPLNASTINP